MEFRDRPDYAEAPLFRNQRLNRSIFLKHTLRTHERSEDSSNRMSATKVILPFDASDLSLGGYSCFLHGYDLDRTISRMFGGDIASEAFRRDIQVLRMMDALPTFDPFLFRERLKRDGLVVSRCYFDLSGADNLRMRDYVQGEIQKIVRLAVANIGSHMDQASMVTEKLMTDETAASLEPLRNVLQLSGEEWREGVFAWKGFLYYSWNIDATERLMPELMRQLLETPIKGVSRDDIREIMEIRRRISCCLAYLMRVALDGVELYRNSYKELLAGKPMPFQEFLRSAPTRFMELGEAFGVIMHIKSFWQFRFGTAGATLSPEEARDIYEELDRQFAAIYDKMN